MDIAEQICAAVDTIVTKKIEGIKYDTTINCTVINNKYADEGQYTVTDGSVEFTAYSANTTYKVNDAVYVTVPNGDFNEEKIIIGKRVANNSTPFTYISPFETIVDVSTNLITNEISPAGLVANNPEETEILLWEKEYSGQLKDFTRLGIQAQFKSWLSEAVSGEYGLYLMVKSKKEISNSISVTYQNAYEILDKESLDQNDWALLKACKIDWGKIEFCTWTEFEGKLTDDKTAYVNSLKTYLLNELNQDKNYKLYFTSNDMYGDVFNFESYYQQEQVFDISDLGDIKYLGLYFYQIPCAHAHTTDYVQLDNGFHDKDNYSLEYQDFLGNLIAPNIFVKDPYICAGYNFSSFDREQAQLYTTSTSTYIVNSQISDADNLKQINLRWVHQFDDDTIAIVDEDSKLEYDIMWYRAVLGASSADEYSGVGWKRLEETPEDATFPCKFEDGGFTCLFTPDTTLQSENVKAIILFDSKVIRTNIVTFGNERLVPNASTIDVMSALQIHCADDSYGNYLIYNQGNQLLDSSESKRCRELEAHFNSSSYDDTDSMLAEATSITWSFPTANTMIRAADDFGNILDYSNLAQLNNLASKWEYSGLQGTTTFYYDEANKILNITRTTAESDGLSICPIQRYYIYGYYSAQSSNNIVRCEIEKDKIIYNSSKEFTFGQAGTSGTDVTLVIDFDNNVTAVTVGKEERCTLTARLYDSTNQQINLDEHALTYEWSWFCATKNIHATTESALPHKDVYKPIDLSYYTYEQSPNTYYFHDSVNNTYNLDNFSKFDETAVYYEKISEISYLAEDLNIIKNNDHGYKTELKLAQDFIKTDDDETKNEKLQAIMNSIYILQVKISGWGDYDLVAYKPIPLRRWIDLNTYYLCITGSDSVIYPSSGEAVYYRDPYKIWLSPREAKIEGNGTWSVLCPHYTVGDKELSDNLNDLRPFIGQLSTKNVLQPATVYVTDAPQYGVQFTDTARGLVAWTQPIVTIQNNYPSTMINKWDGQSIVQDETNGTIMASAISAGKKETDNTFSGVLIGDWSRSDTESAIAGQTGLYGFNHGSMSYAFKDNGTGFIGKAGKGRIYFDGQSSQIYSSAWYQSQAGKTHNGMLLDLDDGYLHMNKTGGYDAANPTAEEFAKGTYYRYTQFILTTDTAYNHGKIYYLPSSFVKVYLAKTSYVKNKYFIKTIVEEPRTLNEEATEPSVTTVTKRASASGSYDIITTAIEADGDAYYTRIKTIKYSLAQGDFDSNAEYYKVDKWSIAITDSIAAQKGLSVEISDSIFANTKYFYEYFNNYVQATEYDLEEKYFIQTAQEPHYITIGANEDQFPVAVGTSESTFNRAFKVAWDGTAYISNGQFSGDVVAYHIDAYEGTLGNLEVTGTIHGGKFESGELDVAKVYSGKTGLSDYKNSGFYLDKRGLLLGSSVNVALVGEKSTLFSNLIGNDTKGTLRISGVGLDLYSNYFITDEKVPEKSLVHLGWDDGEYSYPYMRFGIGGSDATAGVIQKKKLGLWLGTYAGKMGEDEPPSDTKAVTGLFIDGTNGILYRYEKINDKWIKERACYARFA